MRQERIELKTERLLLRPFRLTEVDDVLEYASHPEWARYLRDVVPQPYTRQDAEKFVTRSVLTPWETRPTFAIVHDSKVVGGTNLSVNEPHGVASLGYGIAKVHWGKGLVPEAAKAVVGWGFEKHRLAKIYAIADLRNVQSHRVMQKLGMTREGVLRSHRRERGERVDEVYYGILRNEWEERKRK